MRRGELYRDKSKAKIAGVCAGIADYFGIEIWLVRILTVTAFLLLAGPFMLVAYVAAWFILEEKPQSKYNDEATYSSKGYTFATDSRSSDSAYQGKGFRNSDTDAEQKVEIKAKVWQAGQPPRQAFMDIKHRYAAVEDKLRELEKYVTSSEFQLKREFNKL
jgi:phage shock protein C